MRTESVESEYEMTIKELQSDVTTLRHELHETQTAQAHGDKSRGQIVRELTQQNERLTEQLKKVSSSCLGASEEAILTLTGVVMGLISSSLCGAGVANSTRPPNPTQKYILPCCQSNAK